ncbi:MAG TPA: bifunctional homocysteine S-methyltransferase/methylenetetrahydrofolate reductase [Chthoniobacterales bacterium]|nr:bifunctional homocysteine S-methyltransferase/methylenetetrahydrofolate reductase [Chthoniobacterales bacterium]
MDLVGELQDSLICGDGAMGTLLLDRGVALERCFEELCVSEPARIQEIHEEYIRAGARVIETNTFGGNAVRLERFGFEARVEEINRAAARIARNAAAGKNICVAGSIGPLGITADEAAARGIDRAACFGAQIAALAEGGVDALFFETFMDFDEMEIALRRKSELTEIPAIASFACAPEGRLASGVLIGEAFARAQELGAAIVGANCMNGPHALVQLLERVPAGFLTAAYANAGYPKYHEGRFIYHTAPDYFAGAAREMVAQGARLIGGCCGTNPKHIRAIAAAIAALEPVRNKVVRVIESAPVVAQTKPSAVVEESLLDRIAAGKRVIICELDPPKTLALEKFFTGAQALVRAGCDAITLADNSLAILRVSNLAIGAMLKERFGIMPLLHLSCRDRNVLGLQSELLGMAALGMRHVLPLTGDPARVGDHPGAASVYDVNSVELIAIIKRLNEGFSQAGKAINRATGFVIGCTFNPNAKNMDAQVQRLERKVAAGAQYAMTQPVFDIRLVEKMQQRTAHLPIAIFTGVWPLLSGRQAEFLHNEVPGIVVPDAVRSDMAGREGEDGRARGVKLAQEIAREALARFPGVYLITPFLQYQTTVELAGFARSI